MNTLLGRLRALLGPSSSSVAHPFDREHGVDTSGLLYADKLPSGHAHDCYSEGYYATAPSVFHQLVARWRETLAAIGLGIEDYTFIDLGCGKGRAIMLASQYPFRAVSGVELNAGLVRIARRNVRKWMRGGNRLGRACRSVSVEHGDVLDLVLPEGPVVLFLFNAFAAEIVGGLMEKLAAAAQRRAGAAGAGPIDLLYVHPDHDALVGRTQGIELLRHCEIAFSEQDAGADVFGVSSDVCSMWRIGKEERK
jgi:SAM-dependent methyltransferase